VLGGWGRAGSRWKARGGFTSKKRPRRKVGEIRISFEKGGFDFGQSKEVVKPGWGKGPIGLRKPFKGPMGGGNGGTMFRGGRSTSV